MATIEHLQGNCGLLSFDMVLLEITVDEAWVSTIQSCVVAGLEEQIVQVAVACRGIFQMDFSWFDWSVKFVGLEIISRACRDD